VSLRAYAGLFQRCPNFHIARYPIGSKGKQIARALRKALHKPSSWPSGILSATATTNSSIRSAPGDPLLAISPLRTLFQPWQPSAASDPSSHSRTVMPYSPLRQSRRIELQKGAPRIGKSVQG